MAGPVLKASFDLDGSKFHQSMDRIKSSAKKSVKEIEGLGGTGGGGAIGGLLTRVFGVAGFLIGLKQAEAAIDQLLGKMKKLKDDSAQTGLDPETLQKIGNIGNTEHASKALESLAEAQAKVLSGDTELAKSFAQLGVSLDDIKNKRHQQIFLQIAESMKNAEASAANLNAMSKVLGGKGPDLLPVFRRGLDSPEANAGVISNKDVEDLNKLQEGLEKQAAPAKSLWAEIKAQAARMWTGGKIGALEVARLPKTITEKPKTFEESRGEFVRAKGAERVASRDRARAAAQIEAEEQRKAAEEEAQRRADLMAKAAEVEAKRKRSLLGSRIKGLESARSRVNEDLEAVRGGQKITLGTRSGESMSENQLVRLSQTIVAELQKSNQQLQAIARKDNPMGVDF